MPEAIKDGRFYRKKWLSELIALNPGKSANRASEDGVWLCFAELGHVSRKMDTQRVHGYCWGFEQYECHMRCLEMLDRRAAEQRRKESNCNKDDGPSGKDLARGRLR